MATLEEMKAQRKSQPSYGKHYGNSDRREADRRYNAKRPTSNASREFIAWDGEGIDGKYVLFMNSKGDKITNLDGLSTDECLLFICSIKERYPSSINVVYGGSYDANMILKDLPFLHLQKLQRKHRVYYKYFRIEYIPRKYFRVSQYDHKVYGDKRKRKPLYSVTLWDVIGFFQGSFLKSLEEYFKNESPVWKEYLYIDEIEKGKKRRNEFSEEELQNFIIPYCGYEVTALVLLMNKLRENMLAANIHIARWDGAGAAAAAILKQYRVKEHYQKLPRHIEEVAQVAYGGGRVEMFMYGHTEAKNVFGDVWLEQNFSCDIQDQSTNFDEDREGLIYHYDLIGAYPSVMPSLPSLVGGKWVHYSTPIGDVNMFTLDWNLDVLFDDWTFYKVYWDYSDSPCQIFPFFYRQPFNTPRIFYNEHGYSWVLGAEVRAAMKWREKLGGELHILERWQFVPGNDTKPFAFVEELYKLRIQFKKEGNGAQLALKLAINALYGKMAQTVGYKMDDKSGEVEKLPPFYNLFYASVITSVTRSKMFDAMMRHPESIIAVATDGLWSREPLDVKIGTNLGDWEYEELLSFTSVQAGVYFSRNLDGKPMYHYRGFNQGSIIEDDIRSIWRRLGYSYKAKTRRFITLGTAMASYDRYNKKWRTWEESDRMLEVFPMHNQKREASHPVAAAAEHLIPTFPTPCIRLDEAVKNVNMLTEDWLSRQHPLPWEHVEMTVEQQLKREQEEMIWEIIESDVENNLEIDIEKQREGEF